MLINGKTYALPEPITLIELLGDMGYHCDRVAVVLNGQVVARAEWDSIRIQGEDHLEVVAFVGGG
jgi:sulfur carrier protein